MGKLVYAAAVQLLWLLSVATYADDKSDSADRGKQVYEQCAGCHYPDSAEKKRGPGLKGLFSKEKMYNGKKPTEENVLQQINEGSNRMPGYQDVLSTPQKKDLIAYLKTL